MPVGVPTSTCHQKTDSLIHHPGTRQPPQGPVTVTIKGESLNKGGAGRLSCVTLVFCMASANTSRHF